MKAQIVDVHVFKLPNGSDLAVAVYLQEDGKFLFQPAFYDALQVVIWDKYMNEFVKECESVLEMTKTRFKAPIKPNQSPTIN